MVPPSSILESSTDAPDDRQLKNLKFQTPLATTKNGFPDTLLGSFCRFATYPNKRCFRWKQPGGQFDVVFRVHIVTTASAKPKKMSRFRLLTKAFQSHSIQTTIGRIRARSAEWNDDSTEKLQQRTADLRETFRSSRKIPAQAELDACALICQGVKRALGKDYYDVQLQAGLAVIRGHIAQMQTGEGKTISAALPAFVLGLYGKGVHVATTNYYLAQRDCEEVRPALEILGMSIAYLPDKHDTEVKHRAYQCDITYGTGYEFGFDYLRDQIALRSRSGMRLGSEFLSRLSGHAPDEIQMLQRGHGYAVVDEADSVLIDEAAMPLVLSGSEGQTVSPQIMTIAAVIAESLIEGQDYRVDEARRKIQFTPSGWLYIHQPPRQDRVPGLSRPWSEYIESALRARRFLHKGIDYIVADNAVQIVDQNTGRIHEERTWRSGLHQSVEFKEGVPLTPERQTDGQISRQRYFQLYDRVAGMTGTATGNEFEFETFYNLPVSVIPTNRPSQRKELKERFFVDDSKRDVALALEVHRVKATGQPVLVGTRTIKHTQQISVLLNDLGVFHTVLNGTQNEAEADIVSKAGISGSVVVATNMAGRGTDIKPDSAALAAGGLHVIAAEHHVSARVDRQLSGRAARQGQPGSFQFYSSAKDELFVLGESEIPNQIRRHANADGECERDLAEKVLQLQQKMEQDNYQKRRTMVQRDFWMDGVLESLAKET